MGKFSIRAVIAKTIKKQIKFFFLMCQIIKKS